MRNSFKALCLVGLSFNLFSLGKPVDAIEFPIASFIEHKVEESITSPTRRFKTKVSDKFANFRTKFSRKHRYSRKYHPNNFKNNNLKNNQASQNAVFLSKKQPQNIHKAARQTSYKPQISPEISKVRSSRQFEAQIDEMVLATWRRPDYIHLQDWKEIVISTKKVSRETGIPQQLIMSLINKESGFRKDAVSRSGARGLTQLMPKTAHYECGLSKYELFDVDKNIRCGIGYLEKQMKYFQKLDLAIAAYNAGPGAVRRAVEKAGTTDINRVTSLLKPETAPYVRKILVSINYGSDFM
ncbi:MAG: lytic transglycosylase domain-containing protein [Candidatus Caenarcaniphilales bacterium]|nr:lytic transglycosylase domain-containing protein [Candidatus Caenarcaniphilales bacterium]